MKAICLVLLSVLLIHSALASNLMYPELNVTPRASERLRIEAERESSIDWGGHLPIQISAVSTLMAAMQTASADLNPKLSGDKKKDEESKQTMAGTLGMGVGGFWLAASVWATVGYKPYKSAYTDIAKQKGKSTRVELTRERLAEEELNSLRRLGKTIRFASVISNLAAAVTMGGIDVDEKESSSKSYSNMAALFSLAPLFFKYRWEHVADEQEKYKKKIYSPVAYSPIVQDPFEGRSATGMQLIFTF